MYVRFRWKKTIQLLSKSKILSESYFTEQRLTNKITMSKSLNEMANCPYGSILVTSLYVTATKIKLKSKILNTYFFLMVRQTLAVIGRYTTMPYLGYATIYGFGRSNRQSRISKR
jgi:hypothetical protein